VTGLGLEIGLISSSSWNAGGSWIKPEHGAMGLFRKDTIVNGPLVFNATIPFPFIAEKNEGREMLVQRDAATRLPVFYKEVGILAHPLQPDSSISDTGSIISLQPYSNGDMFQAGVCLPANGALPAMYAHLPASR
jgi:hypothetical protein